MHRRHRGFTVPELAVGLALAGVVLAAAWGWHGSVTKRRLQNAAYLLEADLRWAQQMAEANAGAGPQVEVCLRPDGYDVYSTVYTGDALNVSTTGYTVSVGSRFKTVNQGQEYAAGVQIAAPSAATIACALDASRQAVAFRASGKPIFTDTSAHAITVTLEGRTYLVTVQPSTGLATVSAQ
jgi:prepilin-type N-terminal cleavage/methylation domain-containing protein